MARLQRSALLLALALGPWLAVAGDLAVDRPQQRRTLLDSHRYQEKDPVPLWAAKTGPFTNPSETYEFFSLPYCKPADGVKWKTLGMGEVVDANRMASTPYDLAFRSDRADTVVCKKALTEQEVAKFRDSPALVVAACRVAVALSMVVIEINVLTDPARVADISEGAPPPTVEFSYSVRWTPTTVAFGDRLQRYERFPLNPVHLEIHWFSIINSCVTVLLLTGFLATILARVLKADLVKFSRSDDPGAPLEEDESGWKYVHGDAFRFPPHRTLFCAFLGTGTQALALAACIFALSLVGVFYPYNRGALFTALILLYALTAGVAGYVAGSYYRQFGGEDWAKAIVATVVVYCGPFFGMFTFLNTVAIVYRSTAALPFGTIVIIVLIWGLVTIPLTVCGGIAGKNARSDFNAPCRIHLD
ncbi:hypothetical protein Rsub_11644 [Raphidocelis subcapitata]|uniref:Transmembrane 9 superfamily member n=1 Tax=Raphidocelis subcapitata TaxID=307507 RepID=A0A2V0PLB8_9CHLO|nr:hypothetical protein Rsub_11644 [Raphidocelis subcapitata]|eukprot:GBF98650.1 hypothetical protein Rsub_11644 [Raphidocelis subcapitata]